MGVRVLLPAPERLLGVFPGCNRFDFVIDSIELRSSCLGGQPCGGVASG